jgi:hypothetical protein
MGLKFEDVSPIAGVATGDGFMGDVARSGMMGLLPAMIARKSGKDNVFADAPESKSATEAEDRKRRRRGGGRGGMQAQGMKSGGKVRGNGCCKRTKKCKMY